jgi:hypothetical protein
MKLVLLTFFIFQYLLAPLANASIGSHIQNHHSNNTHDHVNQHGTHHHHDNEESDENKDSHSNNHVHALISIDSVCIVTSFKVPNYKLKDLSIFSIDLFKLNEFNKSQKVSDYVYSFYPPPDNFRNLPLLI